MGVERKGDRLGIGTNLFSDKRTVFEEYGVDFVNTEIEKKSDFMNENILVDPENPQPMAVPSTEPETETSTHPSTTERPSAPPTTKPAKQN